jgi:hypothetical protein
VQYIGEVVLAWHPLAPVAFSSTRCKEERGEREKKIAKRRGDWGRVVYFLRVPFRWC